MVKKFEFNDNSVDLDINGTEFHTELTAEVITGCDSIREEAAVQLKKLSSGGSDGKEKITEVCAFLETSIDRLLGEGAAKQIFKNRRVNLFDLTDVVNFIISEISETIAKKAAYYSGRTDK